jgi:hypothetical protein
MSSHLTRFETYVIIEIYKPDTSLWAKIHTHMEEAKLNSTIVYDAQRREVVLPGHTFCASVDAEDAQAAAGKVLIMTQGILQCVGLKEQDCALLVLSAPKITPALYTPAL